MLGEFPQGGGAAPMRKILVGIDGSDGSRRAAAFARDLARAFQAELTLLHVIEPVPAGVLGRPPPSRTDHYVEQMRQAVDFLGALADELEMLEAEQAIEMGHPGDVICREAAERDVDLIVVGWQGHRAGPRLRVGSVGAHVVAAANRSVTVVQ